MTGPMVAALIPKRAPSYILPMIQLCLTVVSTVPPDASGMATASIHSLLGHFSDWLLGALRAYLYYDVVARYREAVAGVVAAVMSEGGRPFKALTELQRIRREFFLRPLKDLLGSQVNLRELKSRVDQLVGSTADELLFDPSVGPERSLVLGPSDESEHERKQALTTRGIQAVHRFAGIILSEALSTIELALWRLRVSPSQQSSATCNAVLARFLPLVSGLRCYLLPYLEQQLRSSSCGAFLRFLAPLNASSPPLLIPLARDELRILSAQLHATASEFFGFTYCELALQAGAGQPRKILPVSGRLFDLLPHRKSHSTTGGSSWLSAVQHPLYYSFTVVPVPLETLPPAKRLHYDLLLSVTSQCPWGEHREPFTMDARKWMMNIPGLGSKGVTRIALPMDIMDDNFTEIDKDIGDVHDGAVDEELLPHPHAGGHQSTKPSLFFHMLRPGNGGVLTVRLTKMQFFHYVQSTCSNRRMPAVRRWAFLALMLLGGGGGGSGTTLTIAVLSRLHVVRPFFALEDSSGDRSIPEGQPRMPVVCPCVRVAGLSKGVCLFDSHRASQPHRVLRQPTLEELGSLWSQSEASMEIALPTEDVSMRLSDLRDLERNIRFDLPRAEPSMSIAVLSAVGSKLLDTWSRVKNAWDEVDDDDEGLEVGSDYEGSTNDEDERDEELLAPDPKWGIELADGPLTNKKESEFMWDFISPLTSQLPPGYEPEPEEEVADHQRLLPKPDRASAREGVYTYGPMTPPNSVTYVPMFEYKNGNILIDHYQKFTVAHPPSVWHWAPLPTPTVPQSPIVSLPATAAASALLQGGFALATSLYDLQHKRCSKKDVYRCVVEAASRGSAVGACCWTLANVAGVTNVAILSGTVSLLWLALRALTVHSREQLLSDACVTLSGTAAAVAVFRWRQAGSKQRLVRLARMMLGLPRDGSADEKVGSRWRFVAGMVHPDRRGGDGISNEDKKLFELFMLCREYGAQVHDQIIQIVKLSLGERQASKGKKADADQAGEGPLYLEDGTRLDNSAAVEEPLTSIETMVGAVQRFAYMAIVEPQLQHQRRIESDLRRAVHETVPRGVDGEEVLD
ncbi:hypothetical protein Pmar_PMAR013482 [Perkinsus marinus ATCC 50983]|uniref:J domain-containing protein n=1 Tax=Perkinsus marinus (strain ATCC 50983 / TXsc) TaxID=423536 RepID=C5L1Y8_PERM5|nr:hypothetical protein Pmar_PMAR013482 [Perkinsus marinus ATCC 50983]EER09257.1 hypothetical protein Pmar_PMAR013482 [Perkinsus marinus ATCC 50983]|eukprot:XP_002777441.1 hypothetical protein Pmar_PMAR013482 [Perkinsus marinus ATCC 50983]